MWLKSQCSQQKQSQFGAETRCIPRDKKAVCGIVQRRDTLKSRYLTAAFLYALRGASHGIARCVSRYSKQGLCVPQKSQSQPKSADSLGAQPPIPRMKERDAIQAKARKCGLSVTEYVKQRALGYEPRTVPPDALFACLEKLGELADKASSPELDKEICAVLKQITAEFLLPGKG